MDVMEKSVVPISLTERARAKIHDILKDSSVREDFSKVEPEADFDKAFLRLSVEPGGCKGMQYAFSIGTDRDEGDLLIEDGDRVILAIDSVSAPLLFGSNLDYIESLGSSTFKITNPNVGQGGGCGCGKSFTPE